MVEKGQNFLLFYIKVEEGRFLCVKTVKKRLGGGKQSKKQEIWPKSGGEGSKFPAFLYQSGGRLFFLCVKTVKKRLGGGK